MSYASAPLHPLLQAPFMALLVFGPGLWLAGRVKCRAERLAWAFVAGSSLLFAAAQVSLRYDLDLFFPWLYVAGALICFVRRLRRPDTEDSFWWLPVLFAICGLAALAASRSPGLITMGLGDPPSFYRVAQNLALGSGAVNDVWIGDYNGQYLLPNTFPLLTWITAFFFRLIGVNPWSMEVFLLLATVPVLGLVARSVDPQGKFRPWQSGALSACALAQSFYGVALFVGVQTAVPALAALLVFRMLERNRSLYLPALLAAVWSALASPIGAFLAVALLLAAPVFLARPWWRGTVYGALGAAAAFVAGSLWLDRAGPLFGGTFFLQTFRFMESSGSFISPGPQTFIVSNTMSHVGLPGFLQSWPPWVPGQLMAHPVALVDYLVEVLHVAGGYLMEIFVPGALGLLILGGRKNASWAIGVVFVLAASLLFLAASNPVIFPRHHLPMGLWVMIPFGRLLAWLGGLWRPGQWVVFGLTAGLGVWGTAVCLREGINQRSLPGNTVHAEFSALLEPHVERGALLMASYPQMYAFLLSRPAAGVTMLCASQELMDGYLKKYRPRWLILDDFRPEMKNLSLCRDRGIRFPAEWKEFPLPGAERFPARVYRRHGGDQ